MERAAYGDTPGPCQSALSLLKAEMSLQSLPKGDVEQGRDSLPGCPVART